MIHHDTGPLAPMGRMIRPIAAIPAGTTVTPDGLRLLVAAYHHIARPLTAEEARGVIEDGVLSVFDCKDAEFTVSVGEAGEDV
jgi:hypothetical protein